MGEDHGGRGRKIELRVKRLCEGGEERRLMGLVCAADERVGKRMLIWGFM